MATFLELTRRPIRDEDASFLRELFASTRQPELAALPWTDVQKQAFLDMQFTAQHTYYSENYEGAALDLILLRGEKAGRLYIHRRANEIRIMDITIAEPYRGRGIGTHLLNLVLEEGKQAGLPVSIHVERNNRALGLYQRLGFKVADENGVYYLMVWQPDAGEENAG